MIYYRIRNKENPELYLSGTPTYHNWDKVGRVFITIGKLRSFLTNVLSNEYRRRDIGKWEIVEMKMIDVDTKELHQIIKPEKLMKLLKEI